MTDKMGNDKRMEEKEKNADSLVVADTSPAPTGSITTVSPGRLDEMPSSLTGWAVWDGVVLV